MDDKAIRKKLDRVGFITFVEYFELFEANWTRLRNDVIINEFKRRGEPWGWNSHRTKSSAGKWFFRFNVHLEALKIVAGTKRLPQRIRRRARQLLRERKNKIK
jgi:hypothetical protein